MSKVVHVSDDLHAELKKFCKERGLRMSEWVMNLVKAAMRQEREREQAPIPAPIAVAPAVATHDPHPASMPQAARSKPRPSVKKRKPLPKYERPSPADLEEIYSAPPFWERAGA